MKPFIFLVVSLIAGGRLLCQVQSGRSAASTAATLAGGYHHMSVPYDQHWSLGIQRELASDSVVELNYVANKGTNLYDPNPINNPPPGPGAIQTRRPYPTFGALTYNGQDGSSLYNALQAKLQKRFGGGLWALVSYTWSKSIATSNVPAAGGNYAYERALTAFDIPQNLTVSAGYELPFGRGKRLVGQSHPFVTALPGGWHLQGIVVLRSGRPFTPTISRDVANTGVAAQRPMRLGSGKLDDPTVARWFDKTAFAIPAAYTYGNSGADILRENRFKSLDLSLSKEFRIQDQVRLQFRAEAFNFTNTPSFSAPNTNIDVASGGTVTSTISAPRNVQFGMKLVF